MTVTECLGLFYPDVNEPIWLRSFDAKKIPEHLRGKVQQIEVTRDVLSRDTTLQTRLKKINATQGIYFVVNAGGNKDEDITRINAVFCEIDDKSIVEQHDILDNLAPLMPSVRFVTLRSVHAYWLLSEAIATTDFLRLQEGLVRCFNSDRSIKNLSRVMRVPFFNHVRYDGVYRYHKIQCHTFQPDLKYSLAELVSNFSIVAPDVVKTNGHKQSAHIETLEDVKAELRRRVMATPSWRSHGKWGSANGKCHNGEGDTGLRIDLAGGSVTCWSACSLKQILNAFGLELPKNRRFEYIKAPEQTSELYKWYQQQKF